MTVPSWTVVNAVSTTQFRAYDDVLQDLIQGVTGVDSTIGVRRTIVQDEFFIRLRIISRFTLPLIQFIGAFGAVGLQLGCAWAGWER
jgi:hypothetical protein